MMTLKEIYDIKVAMASNKDLSSLQALLDSEGVLTQLNNDRTIRIESSEGLDSIINSVDSCIPKWYADPIPTPVSLVYNILPLNREMCLLRL